MFGFLNVYKPVGKTSHDVVAYFRKLLNIKKIGHTGTLDPFAEGVLPICVGNSTRLIEYLPDDKAYLAFVQLGKATDSYDTEGNVIFESDKKVTKEQIVSALTSFEGEIEQLPPMYSAIKVKGKKLYEYAREGKTISVAPRQVTIHKIELKNFDEEKQEAQVYIECSKGTYIRSIANDLGQNLCCGGYLTRLIRTKAGKFLVEDSIKMQDYKSIEFVEKHLIEPISMLNYPLYNLNTSEKLDISNGKPLLNKSINNAENIILVYNDSIKAVASSCNGCIKVKKVFNND
ncbi:MAG: tRNA pseudouridine(55) synthase TruB [Candidatus Melainabacteria bacterium]|nr:MAG: tRNA pseudouridine(55) synthase TruB [Candidatus Melainabacteria bacterium]